LLSQKSNLSEGGRAGIADGPSGSTSGLGEAPRRAFQVNVLMATTIAKPAAIPAKDNQRADFTGAVGNDLSRSALVLSTLADESMELWFAPTIPRKSIH
jgi:hypothetical protein